MPRPPRGDILKGNLLTLPLLNVERPPKAVVMHLICPLYGGGSGNTLTVAQRPRTPNRGAFLFF